MAAADVAVHHADVAAAAGAVGGHERHDNHIHGHSDDNGLEEDGHTDGVVAVLGGVEDVLADAAD